MLVHYRRKNKISPVIYDHDHRLILFWYGFQIPCKVGGSLDVLDLNPTLYLPLSKKEAASGLSQAQNQ
jgi:hypothetical protein